MANVKFTELSDNATPTGDDIVAIVNDPAGTPTSMKVRLLNLLKQIFLADGTQLTITTIADGEFLKRSGANLTSAVVAPADATYITQTANSTLTNEQAMGLLATGIVKNTTTTGVQSIAAAGSDYVAPGSITTSGLTQNTDKLLGRGTASSGAIEEIALGAGVSLTGTTLSASGTGAPADATYITQTASGGLSAEQALGSLATGIVKNTTTTGVLSIAAAATDYVAPGSITTDGITMNTAKLLGRTTSSAGAVEEIAVGAGLSLSSGTLSASGGSTFISGQFDTYRLMAVNSNPAGTTTTSIGISAIAPSGDAAGNADDADGIWIRRDTGATSGTAAGFDWNAGNLCRPSWLPQVFTKLKTDASIAVCRIWVAIANADPQASSDPASSGIGFRYDTSAGDTTWHTWTNDGAGGGTINDSGVTVSTDTTYLLAIKVVSTSSIEFYISTNLGVSYSLVATHSTNLPASTTFMNYFFWIRTLENVVKKMKHSWTYIREY